MKDKFLEERIRELKRRLKIYRRLRSGKKLSLKFNVEKCRGRMET